MAASHTLSKLKRNPKLKKYLILVVVLIAVLVGVRSIRQTRSVANSQTPANQATSTNKLELAPALATTTINEVFTFPLLDSAGEEVSRVSYVLENAELRDEVILKGQKAKAIKGKVFLIATIKITNDYEQGIQINSKDYIRLQVNGSSEWVAPSIHNDPVEVQAISTKTTRLGFTIDEADANLILRIGEISGEKREIPINFTR